jgi:NAD(P)H-hydrate epimerase
MATAGSGDVLAGIVASMAHIMPTNIEASINASYLHGRAGNLAQKEKTPYGVTASDILNNIFKEIEL